MAFAIEPGVWLVGRWGSGSESEGAMAFAIELSPHARDHVRQLRKREQRIIVDAITLHLAHQPDLPTQIGRSCRTILSHPGNCELGITESSTM
jgi:hypothetical protein